MYTFKKLTPELRREWERLRKIQKVPWHAPPHFGDGMKTYLISAACYEHREIMATPTRLAEWQSKLVRLIVDDPNSTLMSWVVLPNHYHLLVKTELLPFGRRLGRLHNGISTQWNREDAMPGRKVWYRFSDRAIRSERHLKAAINYIHANPVRHGLVDVATDWPWSSLAFYEQQYGLDVLRLWWRDYPVDDMGRGWDDERITEKRPDGRTTNG